MRRLGHILSIALITAGILVIADVGITLAYQEPLSSIYSSIKQGEKESQLKNIEAEFLTQSDVQAIERAKQTKDPKVRKKVESANLSQLGERLVEESKPGDALGRIEAPDMGGLNMDIAILLFDRLTALDAVGPYDVLAHLPDARVRFVAASPGGKRTETGMLELRADEALHLRLRLAQLRLRRRPQ